MGSRNRAVRLAAIAGVVAALVAVIAGCGGGGGGSSNSTSTGNSSVSGSVKFWGIWAATEQKAFQQVIDGFHKQYPNVTVTYASKGNDIPTILSTAIAGGNPPDMADIAQPGLMKQFVQQGHLKPITYAQSTIASNFSPAWEDLGKVNGKLYGLLFKASNKSTLWYNVNVLKQAGVQAPKTWSQLISDAKTIKASGTPAYSLCGANGWTLTDIFENIYLRMWGQNKYDALSAHQIKWTDPTVTKALQDMAQVVGDTGNIYGGTSGALQTDYPTCVDYAFATPPKAAFNLQGDFVSLEILQATKSKPVKDFNVVPFPTITSGPNSTAVETGGDLIVTFRDTPAIEAFMKYLASSQAAQIWAKLGGFGSGNKNVPASVYPDPITKATETPLAGASSVAFDMSDEQPAAFGATTGQGEWGIFQKFLQNPSSISSIQQQLESSAAKAYQSQK
ncbi:MAG TPA: extracellular solute-binding protein [Gaiellaceae bacterium]|jgi:ABC-type glycerol-3-phosphate transport system substrate-binding protein